MDNKYYSVPRTLIVFFLLIFSSVFYLQKTEIEQARVLLHDTREKGFLLPENYSELILKEDGFNNLALYSSDGEILKSFTGDEVIFRANRSATTVFVRELPHHKAVSILAKGAELAPVKIVVDRILQHKEAIHLEASNIEITAPLFAPKVELLATDTLLVNKIIKGRNIQLLSENIVYIDENAVVDASALNGGGNILIGGDYQGKGDITTAKNTYIHPKATIKADASDNGDGGKVIIWANELAQVYGSISAKGKGQGKGGFIETSGKINLDVRTSPDVSAESGKGGEWLLDPHNIVINNTDVNTTAPPNITANADNAQIAVATILGALGGGNVTISTGATGTQDGDITLNALIQYGALPAGRKLTLNAARDIILNQDIRNSGGPGESLEIELNAGRNIVAQQLITGGALLDITCPGNLNFNTLNSTSSSNGGNITLDIGGNITTNNNGGTQVLANAGSGTAGSISIIAGGSFDCSTCTTQALDISAFGAPNGGTVSIDAFNVVNGNLTITSAGGGPGSIGQSTSITTSGTGALNIGAISTNGSSGGGNIIINTSANVTVNGAIDANGNASTGGNIDITANALAIVSDGTQVRNFGQTGGDVTINTDGDINIQRPIISYGSIIRGGNVSLTSINGRISVEYIMAYGDNAALGGNITLAAGGVGDNIQITGAGFEGGFSGGPFSLNAGAISGTPADAGNINVVTSGNFSANIGTPTYNGTNDGVLADISVTTLQAAPFQSGKVRFGNPVGGVNSTSDGNWSNPATWSCNCIPTALDDVTIAAATTVTTDLASNPSVNDLTVDGTLQDGGNNVDIHIKGDLLGISTGMNVGNSTVFFDGAAQTLDVAGGNFGNVIFINNTKAFASNLTSSGIITIEPGTTLNGGAFDFNVQGWVVNGNGIFNIGTSNVNIATGNIGGTAPSANFYNLQLNGTGNLNIPINTTNQITVGGTFTANENITVTGNLDIPGTLISNGTLDVGGNTQIGNNLTINSSSFFAGDFTINSPGLSNNAGITFDGGNQTINDNSGSTNFGDITLGGTGTKTSTNLFEADNLTITANATFNSDLNINNSLNAGTQTVNIGGNLNAATATINTQTSTIVFNGSTTQSINVPNNTVFHILGVNNPGQEVTLNTNITVSNNLNMTNGYLAVSPTNIVSIANGGNMSGSPNGFVFGEVVKIGSNVPFTFHIGDFDGTYIYGPVTLTTTDAGATNLMSALYKHAPSGGGLSGAVDAISPVERWTIYSPNGLTVELTVPYTDAGGRNSGVIDFTNIRFAQLLGLNQFTPVSGAGTANIIGQIATNPITLTSSGTQQTAFTLANVTGGLNWSATAKIWTNATGNNSWNDLGNWLPNGIPATDGSQDIYFQGTYNTPCNIDGAINVASINVEPTYTSTITQQDGNAIQVAGNFNQQGGTFTSAVTTTGDITVAGDLIIGAAGSFTSTSQNLTVTGIFNLDGTGVFTANGGSTTLNAINMGGTATTVTFNNLTISNNLLIDKNLTVTGNLTISGDAQANNPIDVAGNVSITGSFLNNGTIITLDGAAQTLTSNAAADLGDIVFDGTNTKTLGSAIVAGNLAIATGVTLNSNGSNIEANDWAQDGTFLPTTATVNLTGNSIVSGSTNPLIFNNLTISGTASAVTLNQAINVGGLFNITATNSLDANFQNISLAGDFTVGGTFTANNSTLSFIGGVNQAINAATVTFHNLQINNGTAGFSQINPTGDITVTNQLDLTAGVLNMGANFITLGNGAIVVNGGATSYVGGAFYATNVGAGFVYHIGETGTGKYAPVTVNGVSAAQDLVVQYLATGTGGTPNTGIDAVSPNEHWEVTALAAFNADLTFDYNDNAPRQSQVVDAPTLRLAQDIGGNTYDEITGTVGVGVPTGTINTNGQIALPAATLKITMANADGGANFNANAKIWTGATDNSWNVATNWLPNGVPNVNTQEIFFTSTYNFPCTIDAAVDAASITVQSGYTQTITQGVGNTINIDSNFDIQDGAFTGSTGLITIGGDLLMNGGDFTASNALNLSGNFTHTAGIFDATTNNNTFIYIGAGAQNVASVNYYNLSTANTGTKTLGTAAISVANTLDIGNGTDFNPNGQNITVQGDLVVGATGSFTAVIPALTLNGTVAQTINLNGGATLLVNNFVLNNTNGLTLTGAVSIGIDLTLTNGIITAENAGDAVIIEAGSTLTGANTIRYIDGFIIKQGTDAFTFPLGDNGVYAPVDMTAPNVIDNVTLRYLNTAPTGGIDVVLESISPVEYWSISGTTGAQATFTFNYDVQSLVNEEMSLQLAQDISGTYTPVSPATGSAQPTGNIATGGDIAIPLAGTDNDFTLANLPGGTNFKTINTYTATGTGDNWNNAGKWSNGVPTLGQVLIIAGSAGSTVTADVTPPSIANLTIDPNITLDMGSNSLTIDGLFVNDGIFNAGTGTHSFGLDVFSNGDFNFNDANMTFEESFISSGTQTALGTSSAQFTSTLGGAVITGVGGVYFNDLVIAAGADIQVTDNLFIGGSLTNNGGLGFDLTTNFTSVLLTAANAIADLNINGAIDFYDLVVNTSTPYNYIYDSDIAVTNTLDLTNGYLLSATGTQKIIIQDYTKLIGGDVLSFVEGSFELLDGTGASGFVFPIGENGKYAPLTMNHVSGTGNVLVKYIDGPVGGTTDGITVDLVSQKEYWEISTSGSVVASFDFEYTDTAPRLSGVTDPANLVVAQNVGGLFQALPTSSAGSGSPDGVINTGDITLPTTSPDTQFTLGNAIGGANTFDVPLEPDAFYWVGVGSNDWNDANNWSFTSGGVEGLVGVPSATDKVIFDANFSNGCILNVNATVASAEFLDGSIFTISSGSTFSITTDILLIDMGANTFTVPNGSELKVGGNIEINSDIDVQGTIAFTGTTELLNNSNSQFQANNVIVDGELILRDDLTINNQFELAGNVSTDNAIELVVGNNAGASFTYTNGTVNGNFLQYIDGTGNYIFPISNRLLTLQVTNASTTGYASVLSDQLSIFVGNNISANTTLEESLTFEDNTVTELFPEGIFKVISTGAAISYDVEIDKESFIALSETNETTQILSSTNGIDWLSEGNRETVATTDTNLTRRGLTLEANSEKYHSVSNSCTKITTSPVVLEEESLLLACTLEELNFNLSGVNFPEEEFYRFYQSVGGDTIPNTIIAFNDELLKYELLDESLIGQEFYAVIASENGCESPTEPTPITIDLYPQPTVPVLANATTEDGGDEAATITTVEVLRVCENSPLEIPLTSSLEVTRDEEYILKTVEGNTVEAILSENGNLTVDAAFFAEVEYDEDGRHSGEFTLYVTTGVGCKSEEVSILYEIIQLPILSSSQVGQNLEVCEGEEITILIGGKQFDRHSYVIAVDSNEDGEPDDVITDDFEAGTLTDAETRFTRLLPPGDYTFYVSIEDTEYGCTSIETITINYIVHPTPAEPVVLSESRLIVCQGDLLEVELQNLEGQQEFRWYTDIESTIPFVTGNQKSFELPTLINVDSDINEGIYYVEIYDESTECVSNRIPVEYKLLKAPDEVFVPASIIVCQGERLNNIILSGTLETPEDAAYISQNYRIVKGGLELYSGESAAYSYQPSDNEFSGLLEVSIVRVYKIDDETFECESLLKTVPFAVNARTIVQSVATEAASCESGGTLKVTIDLPKNAEGNPVIRTYELIITQVAEDGAEGTPFTRTRTPDETGLIAIPDLAVGDYKLQVNQSNNINSNGESCGLEETAEFNISEPISPKIITEQPTIEWNCATGGTFTDIEVDLGDARFVTYKWYKGDDLSQPIEGANTADLSGIAEGTYQLVVTAEGKEDGNCQQAIASFTMFNPNGSCAEEVAEEEVENLCTLRNALPESVQAQLGWPDCNGNGDDPTDWTGVGFDAEGKVVSLDLSELGLDEIDPELVDSFEELIRLDVSGNELSFEDLEELAPVIDELVANDQGAIGEEIEEVTNINQDLTLSIPSGAAGSRGTVTWIFVPEGEPRENGQVIGEGTEITIENATPQANAGTYYAEIKHPDFPDIIILRKDVSVEITEKMVESDREVLIEVLTELINSLGLGGTNQRLAEGFDLNAPAASWPGVTQELDRCVGLDFSSLGIQGTIPEEIGQLTALRRLSFFDNQLEGEIPNSIGNLTELTYLDLDNNNLSGSVPESIGNLTKLKTLWLSRNAFTSVPENMGNLSELEYLLMQDNQLIAVPNGLGSLSKIRVLDISDNKLESFVTVAPNYPSLERLNLSGNQLQSISLNIMSVPSLVELNLSDNNLESLPVGLPISQSLQKLVVRRNRLDFADISSLDLQITEYSPQKKQLGDELISVAIDGAISLKANIEGNQNEYLWYKDGVQLFANPRPNDSFEILQMSTQDAGEYVCLVTNPQVPDLTLVSRTITVDADCGDVLTAEISNQEPLEFCGSDNVFVQLKATSGEGYSYTWYKDGEVLTLAKDSIYSAFEAGTYTVRIRTTSGCAKDAESITITQNSIVDININEIASDSTSTTLQVNTTSSNIDLNDITWLRNGEKIDLEGSSISVKEGGFYQAEIKIGDCITTSGAFEVEDKTETDIITSLAEEFKTGPLMLYPNPTKDNLTVQFPEMQKEVILILRYIDGREAAYFRHQKVEDAYLNLQGLPRGMYLLEIESEQGHVLKKVIKQ